MPYADNDGVRIYYEVEGDGPPLVLHTGFMGRLQNWRRDEVGVAQGLRGDYRLILLDPRGQGASEKPHDAAGYKLETRARDVTAVLDAEGFERAHFWGYSMGAMVALGLALYAPARVRSLILGGGSPYSLNPTRYREQAALLRRLSMAEYVAQAEASGGPFSPEARAGFLDNDPLALAAHYEGACTYPDLAAVLPASGLPVLLYAGDADQNFAGAQRTAAETPGSTFVALPGVDHAQGFILGATLLPQVRAFLNQQG